MTAEAELTQARLLVAQEAAQLGLWDWDLTTDALVWDARSVAMYGLAGAELTGQVSDINRAIHPDDQPRVAAALASAIEVAGAVDLEFRVIWPDGRHHWIYARGQALLDADGRVVRMIGTNADVTQARAAAHQQAADAQAMAGLVTVAHALGTASNEHEVLEVVTGRGLGLLRAQGAALVLVERGGQQVRTLTLRPGGDCSAVQVRPFPHDFPLPMVDAAVHGTTHVFADRATAVAAFPGAQELYELTTTEASAAVPLRSRSGVFGSLAVAFEAPHPWRDAERELLEAFASLTSQALERISAQADADAGTARLALLAHVTERLSGTLDPEAAVGHLAQLIVPALADWCVVTLVDDARPGTVNGLRDVGSWHVDEAKRPLVERYVAARVSAVQPGAYLLQALSSRGPVQIPAPATASIQTVLTPGEARELIAELAPGHGMVVPLRARGRTVGLLSVFTGTDRGPFDAEDLATLTEVTDRAALALDAARSFRQQRDLATALQRSLLTAPVEPDHVQVVVRYVPAAEAAQVGGDWYDAFMQPDGATMLVIGDVLGHDIVAAATMSQVRTIVRALGAADGHSPARVLSTTDAVLATLRVDTTATAVVARLEQTDEEQSQGLVRLRWSNAGHPPPMVINPDGSVVDLVAQDADLLLGVLPTVSRHEGEVTVEHGATVLLYTDGLVERRDQPLQVGLTRLHQALVELARTGQGGTLDLDGLVDEVLARLLPASPEDDVAVIAVRLHPEVG